MDFIQMSYCNFCIIFLLNFMLFINSLNDFQDLELLVKLIFPLTLLLLTFIILFLFVQELIIPLIFLNFQLNFFQINFYQLNFFQINFYQINFFQINCFNLEHQYFKSMKDSSFKMDIIQEYSFPQSFIMKPHSYPSSSDSSFNKDFPLALSYQNLQKDAFLKPLNAMEKHL